MSETSRTGTLITDDDPGRRDVFGWPEDLKTYADVGVVREITLITSIPVTTGPLVWQLFSASKESVTR